MCFSVPILLWTSCKYTGETEERGGKGGRGGTYAGLIRVYGIALDL